RAPGPRPAGRRCAGRVSPLPPSLSPRLGEAAPERDHGERRPRRVAALVLLLRPGPDPGLDLVLHREDAVADGDAVAHGEVLEPARAFVADDLEMVCLAADDDAQGDKAVITVECHPDDAGNLQRTRHADPV